MFGSATLFQLAFPGERQLEFSVGKIPIGHWVITLKLKKKTKLCQSFFFSFFFKLQSYQSRPWLFRLGSALRLPVQRPRNYQRFPLWIQDSTKVYKCLCVLVSVLEICVTSDSPDSFTSISFQRAPRTWRSKQHEERFTTFAFVLMTCVSEDHHFCFCFDDLRVAMTFVVD